MILYRENLWKLSSVPDWGTEARRRSSINGHKRLLSRTEGELLWKLKHAISPYFSWGKESTFFLLSNSVGEISGVTSVWCILDMWDHPRCPHEANRHDVGPAGLLAFEAAAEGWAGYSINGTWKGSGHWCLGTWIVLLSSKRHGLVVF